MPEFYNAEFTKEKFAALQNEISHTFHKPFSRGGVKSPVINKILQQRNHIMDNNNGLTDAEKYAYLLLFMKLIHDVGCNKVIYFFPQMDLSKKAFKVMEKILLDTTVQGSSVKNSDNAKSITLAMQDVVSVLSQTPNYEKSIIKFGLSDTVTLLFPTPLRAKL